MKDKLVTKNYIEILAANFLLYFGFYLLMPVLPFYLAEIFNSEKGTIGIILSCYTIAALCIRPFSGYLLDTFARKPLYLLAYFLFTAAFGGYLLAGTLTLFTLIRIFHGLAFGTVTVAGNTVVIDIMPSSRRGEGLGYYGMMNNTAMSIGPMVGLFLHNAYSFEVIFWCALVSCALGLVMASLVKTPAKEPVKREPISLDRFILLKGIPAGICLLLLSVPYGMTSNYIAMYSQQIGITAETGFFFTFMAFGMATSRLFSGRLVDRGKITQVIEARTLFGLFLLFRAECLWVVNRLQPTVDYLFLLFHSFITGYRFWNHVSGIQYIVCQSGSQQPTRYSYQHLPYFMGCRYRSGYAGRRIYRTNSHFQNSLFIRSSINGYFFILLPDKSSSTLSSA